MSDAHCVRAIRSLAAEAVQKANSGHPGAAIGLAPFAHVLWGSFMNYEPNWPARDRFVLSNGHVCVLLYTMLYFWGVLSAEDIQNFRQLDSLTPGHPERGHTPGVEVTTGPLGQGIANAVGLAIAQAHLNARYPGLFDHKVYCVLGDGCMMEGISTEAASLAGHLGLNNLIAIYDNNFITIDGPTSLAYSDDVPLKFRALGWNVIEVTNGDTDMTAIAGALHVARGEPARPTLIVLTTTIGYGTGKAGNCEAHGAPLGAEHIAKWRKDSGFTTEGPFEVLKDVTERYAEAAARSKKLADEWWVKAKEAAKTDESGLLQQILGGKAIDLAALKMPTYTNEKLATRQTSQKALEALAPVIPGLIGGAADLAGSCLTIPKLKNPPANAGNWDDFFANPSLHARREKSNPLGRYIRYGVREHAMVAIANGMAAHSTGIIPFVGTFLTFAQYCLPSIRLAALSHLQVLFVGTHDSIGLGEDGPTHQPVEVAAQLRALPNTRVFRPADGNETSECYRAALAFTTGPSILCLTRQAVPTVTTAEAAHKGVPHGAYRLLDVEKPAAIIISTGSEVSIALTVAKELGNVAVVSAPCLEVFDAQPEGYIDHVLPPGVPVVALEAYVEFGWAHLAHYHIGVRTFGLSAPAAAAFKARGLVPEEVKPRIEAVIAAHKDTPAPARVKKLW